MALSPLSRRALTDLAKLVETLKSELADTKFPPQPPLKDGWWIKICAQKTEVSQISLFIGLGGDSGSHTPWDTWTSGDPLEFDVPQNFKQVSEIWFKGIGFPEGRNVYMGLFFRDHCVKHMDFDGHDGEEHEQHQGDTDDFDC